MGNANTNDSLSERADRMRRSRAASETDGGGSGEETADGAAADDEHAPDLGAVSEVAGLGHGAGPKMVGTETAGRTLCLGDLLDDLDYQYKLVSAEFQRDYGIDLPKHAFYRVVVAAGLREEATLRTMLGLDRDDAE